MRMLMVTWVDAESDDTWCDLETAKKECIPTPVASVGWLLHEDLAAYLLALNWDKKNEKYSCLMAIPKVSVISVRELKLGNKIN